MKNICFFRAIIAGLTGIGETGYRVISNIDLIVIKKFHIFNAFLGRSIGPLVAKR